MYFVILGYNYEGYGTPEYCTTNLKKAEEYIEILDKYCDSIYIYEAQEGANAKKIQEYEVRYDLVKVKKCQSLPTKGE